MTSLDFGICIMYTLVAMGFEKTKALLAYIVKQHTKASITVLMKLSYLIDLINVKNRGCKLSRFNYVRYLYGPYDSNIAGVIDELTSEKVIIPNIEYTYTGEEYVIYSYNEDAEFDFSPLSQEDIGVINQVLEQLKGYGAKTLTEIAYKTKPMKKIGAELDNANGIGETLDLSCD